jgi:flagellar M-ring protein FliF
MLRTKQQLNGFSTAQKVIGALLVVGIGIAALAFGRWVTAPTYAPLFSNLAGSDASAIVDKLDADGVKYQLTNGGTTVLVPKDVVYAERVKLSGAGLPSSSDGGYSLLDKQGVTASQFQQQVTYQRALEGELAKTVEAIDGVSSAVVHLAIPQKDVFLDAQSKPSASVLVSMKPGSTLTDEQVQSVVHLVASSIEGMDASDVTVVDGKGNLLSTKGSGAAGTVGSGTDSADQVTAGYESREAAQLQAVLDRIVGPNRAVAQVNAQLQFDDVNTTTERVYTDKQAKPLAESTTTEKYSGGAGSTASGVLGTDNIAVPSGSAGGGKYTKKTTTVNNAESKITEKRTAAPGSLLHQSVSVVVDSKATGVNLTNLTSAISAAAGIDPKRGDTISVTQMPFDTSAAAQAAVELKKADAAQKKAQLFGYAKKGVIGLGVAVVLLFLFLSFKKKAGQASAQELLQLDLVEQRATAALPGAAERQALDAAGTVPALESGTGPTPATPQRRKDDVLALVERQPDEVAELLRGWLADRRG